MEETEPYGTLRLSLAGMRAEEASREAERWSAIAWDRSLASDADNEMMTAALAEGFGTEEGRSFLKDRQDYEGVAFWIALEWEHAAESLYEPDPQRLHEVTRQRNEKERKDRLEKVNKLSRATQRHAGRLIQEFERYLTTGSVVDGARIRRVLANLFPGSRPSYLDEPTRKKLLALATALGVDCTSFLDPNVKPPEGRAGDAGGEAGQGEAKGE